MTQDLEQAQRALALAEKRAVEARADARHLAEANAKLQETLRQARDRLAAAREQLAAMSQPPLSFATVTGDVHDDTVEVVGSGRRLVVAVDPHVQRATLTVGSQVLLNDSLVVVGPAPRRDGGDLAVVQELLDDGSRAIVSGPGGEDQVVRLTPSLQRLGLRHGDSVLVDRQGAVALERVERQDVEDLVLEEVPDMDYTRIGGLAEQIQQVRDAVELPFLHADLYAAYGLAAPKGVLLYGPPGTGKTMIAKAVAASIAERVAEMTGGEARSYFLNIKGPELLNKYVGETERQIRVIFQRARERATAGMPVIVFFDEMDSLFRTRGSGVSSDVENTIVPQLLSEIDGVEGLANVIIIGASNREDLIDPAILRPGRLDVKIKLDRPDETAAREIFAKYLDETTPVHPRELARDGDAEVTRRRLIGEVVDFMYARSPENKFLEVTYASGDKEVMYFRDFSSGAIISNIVGKAKQAAIKAEIDSGERGVTAEQLRAACLAEFAEHEDLPNTTNPDDWARISGKRGERIVFIRTLVGGGTGTGKSVDAG